jgi:hypothetical protein
VEENGTKNVNEWHEGMNGGYERTNTLLQNLSGFVLHPLGA